MNEPVSANRDALAEEIRAGFHDRECIYLDFDGQTGCVCDERAAHFLASAALTRLLAEAWDEGYVAGNSFGYEYAQDTYDGPSEDPTPNPYAAALATPTAEDT